MEAVSALLFCSTATGSLEVLPLTLKEQQREEKGPVGLLCFLLFSFRPCTTTSLQVFWTHIVR